MKNIVGKRVRLEFLDDHLSDLKQGDEGTIFDIDSNGTVHVQWDNGSALGLIPGIDKWSIIEDSERK